MRRRLSIAWAIACFRAWEAWHLAVREPLCDRGILGCTECYGRRGLPRWLPRIRWGGRWTA